MKGDSPFTPGSPAPIDLFVGREDQIKEVLAYIQRSASGRQENMFLTGERGIGKSSLAKYIRQVSSEKQRFLTIHVHLGGAKSVDEVVYEIFNGILKETHKET